MPSQETERLVGSRYALGTALGRGGMGTVWRATDRLLQRAVAIKEVQLPLTLPEADRAITRSRVLREARAAARISHPGAVIVYDVVEEDDRPYIVMELVEAPTLEEVVRRDGPLDDERAARMGLEILGALEAAHAEGIVHRDVKPANVMLPARAHAKLADFGIASVKGDPTITTTGLVLGSPSYMAPEQAKEDVTGAASDLWSLGATLYFAVEGVPPFDKGHALPTLTAVVGEEPRPPRRAGAMRPVVDALLQKDPARRPTPYVMRSMLEDALRGEPVPEPVVSSHEAGEVDGLAPARSRAWARPRSRPWLAVLAAAGLLALVGLLLFVSSMTGNEDTNGERARQRRAGAAGAQEGAPAGGIPVEDWETYEDPDAGYRVSYPEGWTVVPVSDTITDFRDPQTGSYLRMDWTATPGDDPVAAWEAASASFGA
ncbi:MAG: serine/threonine protein kinase, partial [Actinomycetota bacterium]|nr:serine/threonine protein kinase [Actinomycetota bacterium]